MKMIWKTTWKLHKNSIKIVIKTKRKTRWKLYENYMETTFKTTLKQHQNNIKTNMKLTWKALWKQHKKHEINLKNNMKRMPLQKRKASMYVHLYVSGEKVNFSALKNLISRSLCPWSLWYSLFPDRIYTIPLSAICQFSINFMLSCWSHAWSNSMQRQFQCF